MTRIVVWSIIATVWIALMFWGLPERVGGPLPLWLRDVLAVGIGSFNGWNLGRAMRKRAAGGGR